MKRVVVVTFTIYEKDSPKLCDTSLAQLRYYFEKGYFCLGDTYDKTEGEDILTPSTITVIDDN